jgi:hypothetical protein
MITTTHKLQLTTRSQRVPTGKSEDGRQIRSNEEAVRYWTDSLVEREPRSYLSVNSIIVDNDRIYSYGKHFEMARIIRRPSGRVSHVITNTDSWQGGGWTSTSDHQSYVRHALTVWKAELNLRILELPFSALEAAGVDLATVRIVHHLPSRWEKIERESTERPGEYVYTGDTLDTKKSSVREGLWGQHCHPQGVAKLGDDGVWRWTEGRHWMGDSVFRGKSKERRQRKLTPEEEAAYQRYASLYRAHTEARDAYFRLPLEERDTPGWKVVQDAERAASAANESVPNGLTHTNNGRRVSFTVHRWASYLSSFDYNEPHRPYFLCELPHGCKASTVAEAVDALMPSEVRTAVDEYGLGVPLGGHIPRYGHTGHTVQRQGDIFAIPTGLSTEALEALAIPTKVRRSRALSEPPWTEWTEVNVTLRRSKAERETYERGELDIYGTNHRATHMLKVRHANGDVYWYGRGRLYHSPDNRDPDHRVQALGDRETWFRFVKNTVPTDKSRGGGSGTMVQSHSARAWTVMGVVD